jgi:NAD(P)-dependent dehydrogenase (short-subunit alcohol dehydrogenase family)
MARSKTEAFRLDGKAALITGAATGIGAGIAVMLARQGADVAISDKPGISLAQTAQQARAFGHRVFPFELDVRDAAHWTAQKAAVRSELGPIGILVNNAGINRPAPGLQLTESEWDDHFATNVRGGFFLAQQIAPEMIEQRWGRVIWISSQSGLVGVPGQPAYCSSKGAVVQLVRTLGLEWAKYGITVNSVAPTFVETNLTRERLRQPEFLQFVLNKIPAGELATVEDVAAAVVFLASEEARMVNCHALSVDGGWTAW